MEVKKLNRNRVFRYINNTGKTAMSDVASALGMSGPTVLQMVKELTELQVVEEVGVFKSTGGRKAKAIAPVKDFCYALGLDITRNHVSMVLVNLAEEVLKYTRIRRKFVFCDEYFIQLSQILDEFVKNCEIPKEKIVGVGIAVPGIVDHEKQKVVRAHTLDLQNVPLEQICQHIPYPCVLVNDANAAAMVECVRDSQTSNMVYLSLSNTVGGSFVLRQSVGNGVEYLDSIYGKMYLGSNWRSGEFGHMVIHPKGRQCYCGKQGCLDAFCSALRLADLNDGNLEAFFLKLEAGDSEYAEIWDRYLEDLAIAVDNLRMCYDCEVVLGGYVGSYMEPYMERFRKMVAKKNIFEDNGDYVSACRYRIEAIAYGAAVLQIEKYIDSI